MFHLFVNKVHTQLLSISIPSYGSIIKIIGDYLLVGYSNKLIRWSLVSNDKNNELSLTDDLILLLKYKIQVMSHDLLTNIYQIDKYYNGVSLNMDSLYIDVGSICQVHIPTGQIMDIEQIPGKIPGEGFGKVKTFTLPKSANGFFFNNGILVPKDSCGIKLFRWNGISNIEDCYYKETEINIHPSGYTGSRGPKGPELR